MSLPPISNILNRVLATRDVSKLQNFANKKQNQQYIKIVNFNTSDVDFIKAIFNSKLHIDTKLDIAIRMFNNTTEAANNVVGDFITKAASDPANRAYFNRIERWYKWPITRIIPRELALEWIRVYQTDSEFISAVLKNKKLTSDDVHDVIAILNLDISNLSWKLNPNDFVLGKKLLDLYYDKNKANDIAVVFTALAENTDIDFQLSMFNYPREKYEKIVEYVLKSNLYDNLDDLAVYHASDYFQPFLRNNAFKALRDNEKIYLLKKFPKLEKYIDNLFIKKLQLIQVRKWRERITESDYVYKWEEICSGKISMSFKEFFKYVLDIAMVIVNIKDEDYSRDTVKYLLLRKYRDGEYPPKRAACIDIIDMVNEYTAYIKTIECDNDLIEEDSIEDIPIGQLVLNKVGNQTYCYKASEVEQMQRDPYTREPWPEKLLEQVKSMKNNKNWVFDKNEQLREEFTRDNIKYSSLWNKLNIKDYPISETDFKNMPMTLVKKIYETIKQNAINLRNHDVFTREIHSHIDFVEVINNFLGRQIESDFDTKKVLVNEIMRKALNNDL